MLKVAIIRRGDIGAIDGVNRFVFTLADGLSKLGYEVAVFGHHMTNEPSRLFGVNVKTMRISDRNGGSYAKCMWDWFMHGSKVLTKFEPDMVLVNGVVPLKLKAFKVAVNHGNAIFELRRSRLKRYVTKMLYNAYDYVVCVSSKVASEMEEMGLRCDGIIPIPIKLENYNFEAEREELILHVGTVYRKRPDISVKAVRILRNLGYDVRLVLVGPHEKKEPWIIVKSACPDVELRRLYSRALVLMLPSVWEGFPYVVLEAQACGTPVIAAPVFLMRP